MIIKTDAIFLKSMNYNDTSKIFTAFTKEVGLVKLIAKGIRSGKNRKFSSAGTGTVNSIIYYTSRNSDLHIMTECEPAIATDKILTSIKHLNISVFIMESLLQSLSPELPSPILFDSTAECLQLLNTLPTIPFIIFIKHQLLLAEAIGYEIEISSNDCNSLFYDYVSSSLISDKNKAGRLGFTFSENESKILNTIKNSSLQNLTENSVIPQILPQEKLKFLDFFTKYFSFHLEKQFNYTVY